MRKLIVSMNITLDGYMSGPHCELDWHLDAWTEDMAITACEQLSKADTILLGRVTYEAMAAYWPAQVINLTAARTDIDFADMMNQHRKIVFSTTLESATWKPCVVVRKDVRKQIENFKEQPGKNLIIYGSGKLIKTLLNSDLVDEYQLWVHPVLLGRGHRLFSRPVRMLKLQLYDTRRLSSGVIFMCYRALK